MVHVRAGFYPSDIYNEEKPYHLTAHGPFSGYTSYDVTAVFSVNRAGIHGIQQDSKHVNWLSVGFFVYSALFSLSYLYYPNPLFHQVRSRKTSGCGVFAAKNCQADRKTAVT